MCWDQRCQDKHRPLGDIADRRVQHWKNEEMLLHMIEFLEILETFPKLMRLPNFLNWCLCIKDQKMLGICNNGMCFLAGETHSLFWKEHRPTGWHRRDSYHPLRQMWSQCTIWISEGHRISKGGWFSTKEPWFLRTAQVTPGFVAKVNPSSWIWTHCRSGNSPFKEAIYVSKKKKKVGTLEATIQIYIYIPCNQFLL